MRRRLRSSAAVATRAWVGALALTLALVATSAFAATPLASRADAPPSTGAAQALERGAVLYRLGDWRGATDAWRAALDAATSDRERARCAYNLGNAAYRSGAPLAAVGWYTASLELAPRDRPATANLALARAEAGLPPLDAGGLTTTLGAAVGAFTAAEAAWLALLGVALFAVGAALEATLGGVRGRAALLSGGLALLLSFGPLVHRLSRPTGERALVVAQEGLATRSEPRADAKRMGTLDPGGTVTVTDRYLDWSRVRSTGGEFWVPNDGLFDLIVR